MDKIEKFFEQFGIYCKYSNIDTILFWVILLGTPLFIWLLTTIVLKLPLKKEKFKTIFRVHRAWFISSCVAATVVISIICYFWSKNIFSRLHYELALLIALVVSMLIPIISIFSLNRYYSRDGIKEITAQPKSEAELNKRTIPLINKAFHQNKIWLVITLFGFLFLFFSINKGINLISIVFDNSDSMSSTNAVEALTETFDKLPANNEIIFTTLNGLPENGTGVKSSAKEIMQAKKSSDLKAGLVTLFNTPQEAKNGFVSILNSGDIVYGSPICEALWKMWLTTKETKQNTEFKNKLLIMITDGNDNCIKDLKQNDRLFYTNEEFTDFYSPERTYILDFSEDDNTANNIIAQFQNEGCDVTNAVINKYDYLSALENALGEFQKEFYLIAWLLSFYVLFSIIILLTTPKRIL